MLHRLLDITLGCRLGSVLVARVSGHETITFPSLTSLLIVLLSFKINYMGPVTTLGVGLNRGPGATYMAEHNPPKSALTLRGVMLLA